MDYSTLNTIPISIYRNWGLKNSQSVNRIQYRAIRYFLGLPPKTPLCALQGEVGWYTQRSKKWLVMVRFWNRLMKMSNDRITRKIFDWDWEKGNDSWAQDMKYIFGKLNLNDIWLNKSECDIATLQEKLFEMDKNEWAQEKDSKPKLRTYRMFKDTYATEKYVLQCIPKHERSLMAQLRCGVLPLEIETGRYKRLDVDERKCKICNSGQVEDESHFILQCSEFSTERHSFFKDLNIDYINYASEDLLKLLMTEHQKSVCKFIISIWHKRKTMLYVCK